MKKLILLLLFIPLVFSCSGNDNQEDNQTKNAVEYIKTVDGFWVKSKTIDVEGMCQNNVTTPTVVKYDDYYKFYLDTNLNHLLKKTGRFCSVIKDELGNIIEFNVLSDKCLWDYDKADAIHGDGSGYVGSVDGNVIIWDSAGTNYRVTLSNDRKSLNVDMPGNNNRDEGTYILVSTDEVNAVFNSLPSCPDFE